MKKYIKQIILTLLTALAIGLSVLLTACNVTRTITTTSSSVKRGDTTVIIQSKTIESYDASRSADRRYRCRQAAWGAPSAKVRHSSR